MPFQVGSDSFRIAIEMAVSLLLGMIAREFARAWMASRLGDPTPRLWGRLTWNPRSWFDPFGSGYLYRFIGDTNRFGQPLGA